MYNIGEVIPVDARIKNVNSPLFDGIGTGNMDAMLGCTGYHIGNYQKGQIIILEEEQIRHVGIVLSGAVDMVKEDVWGNKTLLARMEKNELFGETFACGDDNRSAVTFVAPEDTTVLFLPFHKMMHTCTNTCAFHQKLVENMVRIIANKNRDLMRKVEIISKKSLREKILTYLSIQSQAQNSRYFEIPLSRQALAAYLSADRTALARELGNMKADGLIDFDKNMFRIL